VQIVDGTPTEGRHSAMLKAGMMVVVPQNAWHQFGCRWRLRADGNATAY